ncbi:MAG: hypothetical protein LQ341_004335, partial [Variospora aurantia]
MIQALQAQNGTTTLEDLQNYTAVTRTPGIHHISRLQAHCMQRTIRRGSSIEYDEEERMLFRRWRFIYFEPEYPSSEAI